mmetsp:Transcript_82897/g.182228  ORF Transcript_82897/g.182228 Transcript_82897/m.182228 type:complete len:91 (+) Transcript_82897:98-370(+)
MCSLASCASVTISISIPIPSKSWVRCLERSGNLLHSVEIQVWVFISSFTFPGRTEGMARWSLPFQRRRTGPRGAAAHDTSYRPRLREVVG